MSEIPEDVMQNAKEAYDRSFSFGEAQVSDVVNSIARAILAERYACAKIADGLQIDEKHPRLSPGSELNAWWSGQELAASKIAEAIRRR